LSENFLRRLRYVVIEALYEAETSSHSPEEAFERRFAEVVVDDPDLGAARRKRRGLAMVQGVTERWAELDEQIAAAAPRFPLDSMAVVDRNILRLAIWELLADTSAPTGAVINEAVELARRYAGERSPAFINGVLRTVAERVRGDAGAGREAAQHEMSNSTEQENS
jgi:N utilization substance protein B